MKDERGAAPAERVLTVVAPGAGHDPAVEWLLSRFDPAAMTVLLDGGSVRADDPRFAACGEVIAYPEFPGRRRLMRRLRSQCFTHAYLVAGAFEPGLGLLTWAAGAPVCRWVRGEEGKDVRIKELLVPALSAAGAAALFFPALQALRLCFAAEKYVRPPPPPPAEHPPFAAGSAVSVVVPTYDGRDLLEECLPSVTAEVERYGRGSETIVVDDASADGSAEFLRERFPGVRVLALEKNAGFGAASDAGIRAARSDLVLLLNSDITMEPGSLDPLVETIASAPGAFAVQPRTLFPEGGLNFGVNMGRLERGYPRFWNEADIPGAPRVDSLFPTLYCLGGAMLFDRRKYEALGGFDPLFHPFRWEDIDLCYRARKRGWDCLYQPASRMVHKHHATLNRVFTPDYLNVIETRNEILFAWKNLTEPILVDEHLRALPGLVAAHLLAGRGNFARGLLRALPRLPAALRGRRRERRAACRSDRIAMNPPLRRYRNFRRGGERKRPQILVLNPVFPYPPIDGGKHRVYNVLKAAAEENDIHLLCFADRGSEPEIGAMREFCASVETVPFPADFGYLGPKREALFPMYYRNYCSPEMEAKLRAALKEKPIDVVQVETDKMLFYAGSVDSLPVVYVDQDVAGLYFRGGKNPPHRGWRRAIDVFEWLRTVRWETVEGRRCWTVVTVSEEDEEILRRLLPGADVRSVRHGTCVEEFYAPYREVEENSLLYVGSFGHYPNVEAVEYLIGEVWPLIRREVPDATLTVVGSHPTPEILARGGRDGIEVTGFVESVRPYLDRAAVFVAPMRKGMGMKGKVLEAMVRGKPVVTTSIGIRGAAVEPGRHLLVGDTPEAFAAAAVGLLRDRGRRRALAEAGQKLAASEYDWSYSARQMDGIYRELMGEA